MTLRQTMLMIATASLTCQIAVPDVAAAAWSAADAEGVVSAQARSKDGHTLMYLTCNRSDHALSFTFEGYRGRSLSRKDDVDQAVVFRIVQNTVEKEFPAVVYYYSGDATWVEKANLPSDFLDSFGHEGDLSLNSTSKAIASFSLAGAEAVTRKMQAVCRI